MKVINVNPGHIEYNIYIKKNVITNIGNYLDGVKSDKNILIISDKNVYPLYGKILVKSLESIGYTVNSHTIEPGETSKDINSMESVFTSALCAKLTRQSIIIALGGGVVGDLAGFIASTYMRGINYVQVPTTLLAQVDSSVGGKVAVNHPQGKNIIGSFYHPSFVLIDINTLSTLPSRELYTGLSEVIKYGIIWDAEFFDWLFDNIEALVSFNEGYEKGLFDYVIEKCCTIKAHITSMDEREHGIRAILNFGHTIGHGIESATGYNIYTHGEAVAIGMMVETHISLNRGYINDDYAMRIKTILENAQLSIKTMDISISKAITAMKHDKKNTVDNITFILPVGRGKVDIFYDVTEVEIINAFKYFLV